MQFQRQGHTDADLKSLKQDLSRHLDALATLLDRPVSQRLTNEIEPHLAAVQSMQPAFNGIAHAAVQNRTNKRDRRSFTDQAEATQIAARISTITQCVRAQISGNSIPLMLRPDPVHPLDSHMRQTDALMSALQRFVNPLAQNPEAYEQNCHTDIVLPHSQFMAHLHAAYRIVLALRHPAPLRFLDVGCGGGLKVLSAASVFDQSDGLELDKGYAGCARRLLEAAMPAKTRLIEGDALKFENYAEYRVIYFYMPISDKELLWELEQRIIAQAAPQTVLIAPYDSFATRAPELGCHAITSKVHVTHITQDDAEKIRNEAEHVGLSMERTVSLGSHETMWQNIVDVSLRNGHNPMRIA